MSASFANQQLVSSKPGWPIIDGAERQGSELAASAGSVVLCVSAGCGQRKHAAQWLMDYPRIEWFPMCDRARHRLMHPPKLYRPGLSADDFTPLPLNSELSR